MLPVDNYEGAILMEYSAKTNIGRVKENNEDSFLTLIKKDVSIFAVADGMGGHDFGEEASLIATTFIKESCKDEVCKKDIKKFILDTFQKINKKINKIGVEKKALLGMGTTLTLAVIVDNRLYVGHVGDSRLYIANKDIKQITKDHSYVEELIDKGMISRSEAKNHPKKHIITRALGTIEQIKVDIIEYSIMSNDVIIVCSDGLTNLVDDYEIRDIIFKNKYLEDANKELIDLANNRGGYDNMTIVTIKYI